MKRNLNISESPAKRLYFVITSLILAFASGCSNAESSTPQPQVSQEVSWYSTLPVGFEPIKTSDGSEILVPDFAFKMHQRGTFDCPKNWRNCRQVAVISKNGCTKGVFASIVGKLKDYAESEPYVSEKDSNPLQPNEIRVLKFKLNDEYWNGTISPIPTIFTLGCNN